MADEEGVWAKEHPEPGISGGKKDDDYVTLWNFPVAKADLAPEHDAAIRRFASVAFIAESQQAPASFDVVGHASKTGQEQANVGLAKRRADNVGDVLKGMGFESVAVAGAGSSQPEAEGTSGQALARNRRVTVTLVLKSYRVVTRPEKPRQPSARRESDPEKDAVPVRVNIKLLVCERQTAKVMLAAWMIGELTVTLVNTKANPVDAGVVTADGRALTEEFAQTLAQDVVGPRLDLPADAGTGPPSIKVAIEAEEWFLYEKIAYQRGPYFIYFNFKAIIARFLPVFQFRGIDVYMEFTGNLRFELGPSASTIATYRSSTDPGPDVTGTVGELVPVHGGALMIADTITAAAGDASPLAQQKVTDVVLNLAAADGAASRAAWEVLGDAGRPAWEQRKVDWGSKRVSEGAQKAWLTGSNELEGVLIDLEKGKEGARAERKNAWKTKYGGAMATPDFEFVREAVFQALKGYDDDRGDLKALIDAL